MAASTWFRSNAMCGDGDRSSEDDESVKRLKEAPAGVDFLCQSCGSDDPAAHSRKEKSRTDNKQAAAKSLQRTKGKRIVLSGHGGERAGVRHCVPESSQPAACIHAPLMDHMSVAEHHSWTPQVGAWPLCWDRPQWPKILLADPVRWHQAHRICFDDDDQDASALQITPEFRSHVAEKLGKALDRLIKISGADTTPLSCEHSPQESGDGDDSFRLFSSSVPGCHPASPVALKRRRQTTVPSSDEDSDGIKHQQLVESAISGEEIIQNGALHALYKPVMSSMAVKRIHDKSKVRNKNKMSEESTIPIQSSANAKWNMLDGDSRRTDLGDKNVKNAAKHKLECDINAVSKNKGFQDSLSEMHLLSNKIIISNDSKQISEEQSETVNKKRKKKKQKLDQK
uniref:protein CUSTOS isoform X1 n=1 Tax=Myxine glutinosa TaxID=7769 RepID=UPI00358E866D